MAIKISGNTVIDDSKNITSSGTMSANAYIGDGSQLTNLPGGGNVLEATASGTLADGSKVIVNTDGTVSAVTQVGSGWIASLGGSDTDLAFGVAVDSSGNVYVSGYTGSSGAGANDILIAKHNSSGTIQWQRTLGSNKGEEAFGIAVDSSDNVYVGGITQNTTGGQWDILIVKYNSSGTIQWQRTLGGTGFDFRGEIATDSSGNVYVFGLTESTGAGNSDFLIAKYNSSGTIQWQRTLGGSGNDYGRGMTVDSSGNVYVVGNTGSSGAGGFDMLIAKYNTSGAIQWQRTLGDTGGDEGEGIAVDSSGNVYVSGLTSSSGAGANDILIAKYNSSGTIQWQRTLGGASADNSQGIAVDSSGNAYITGRTYSPAAGSNDIIIAKYNTSGAIQWQRTLGGTGSDIGFDIIVDNLGSIYIVGETYSIGAGGSDFLIAKLSDDGSTTGTYGSFTYATSSLTDSTSSLTSSTSSLTDSSSSLTSSTSSLTDSSSSLTSTTTSMVSTTLTSENFIGISDGAYTNGQSATIQLAGSVDDAQSGLTPGSKYYVQGDGTLSTTADSPSVFAGTAVSTTKLVVKN
jgi:uncharacterized delta-60 repeat protein